jgi:chemotaxis protein CheD
MAVACNDGEIRTVGIGSCMVISIYDHEKRVGGMVHAMLPQRDPETIKEVCGMEAYKYVNEAVECLTQALVMRGAKRENLEAKLVGGANMLKTLSEGKYGIGARNLQMAREKLKRMGIPIKGESVGGTAGRMALFNISNGVVNVSTCL